MASGPDYAELHCVSNFSFLRGASHPDELVSRAAALGYSALALTDECSLAGVVRAWQASQKVALPLITGAEFTLEDGLRLVLLAENHDGYSRLCRLITQARRRSEKGAYRIGRGDFARTSDCFALWLPGAQVEAIDATQAEWTRECFGEAGGIALEVHRSDDDAARIAQLRAIATRCGLPLVACGDVHMHTRARRPVQDTLTAIRHRLSLREAGERLFPNGERHLRSRERLAALYPADTLRATLPIAERCRFNLGELRYEYPHELVPAQTTASAHLRALTLAGASERWPGGVPPDIAATIEKELRLIAELKYEHFFLTVEDLVRFARSRGILCQGRGSAANSVVCYALGVTAVDPHRIGMLFERFISKERAEPPDIDVDFEHQRREEVIQYVYAKYGRERAALAATVICYRPKSALRDVGKALGLSLDQVDAIAGAVAWFDDFAEMPERLRELGLDPQRPVLRRLLALTGVLLGFPRHLSQHVGGFVISQHPLSTLVPVENAAMPDRTIIQWDKDDLEALGLLKVDVLALGMLSAIRRALEMVAGFEGRPFAITDVPAEDPATYAMLCKGDSVGVFQVESRAQMSMLPRLKPVNYYDLVIEVAIVRPGPIQGQMVHPYLRRRKNEEKVDYPSEELRKVLQRTLGVPLFQEQVMQIAIVAAGFSAGEADQVRRSMAAWRRNGGLDHFRDRLLDGMRARGYPPEFAERIYQQILGFSSYGFPESHAASFALLVYVSAWLKCHRPAAFTAGLLNSQPMGFYAPAQLIADARRAGVEVRPVDVLVSDWDCTLEEGVRGWGLGVRGKTAALRLGLRMVLGLAEDEARRVVALRASPPRGIDELVARARLSRRAVRLLAASGALAGLAGHRHAARWAALGAAHDRDLLAGHAAREPDAPLPMPSAGQEVLADYAATGFSLRAHPLALLRARLRRLGALRASDLAGIANGRRVTIAGLVTHRQRPEAAAGVMFVSLEDETGISNLVVWPKVQERQRRELLGSRLVLVDGELQNVDGVIHVVAQRLRDCSDWLGTLRTPARDFH
ncbi:MAG TPA: error-prone DNA polymerase [Verrucomicrobiae bacterium]|nr:error-prone DNA polymerase [Verrucomicrobiae bacterium]